MTGDARKEGSKWDRKEESPDIVEISEDESLPMNTDDQCKDGDMLPSQNFTNGNRKQLGESSNPKPDAAMQQGSAGHEQERTDGFDKDIRERQSKASSERSQPPRMADEEHNNNDWGKSGLGKATDNQGMSRYADDRRRGNGWGTASSRGYSSRMPSDPDAWRQRSCSPSSRGVWNRSHRNRSRSRSRGKSRSRSRSRGRGRGRSRSQSPYFTDRGSEWRVERGRTSGGPALPCRDFAAGRCRRGSCCRFPHEDGGRKQFDRHYPGDSREWYGHQPKELMDSREPNDYLRNRQSRGHFDEGTWERSESRRDYRSTEQCHDFVKGRCSRGASCRYVHDDSASHGGWRDEVRESAHGRGGPDSSYGSRTEHRRANKNPCKFFAEGRCRRGQNCPYLHEEAPQSQMGLDAPDESLNYSDGRTRGNYLNWGEQTNATHASSQILSRDDRENPGSQSTGRSDSLYEYKNQHLKDAGRNQYQIFPREDFGSQGQNKPEVAASQQPQFLNIIQTSADSTSNDKVSGVDGQSAPATAGNLSMQTGMHTVNLIGGQNLGQIAQCQDAVPQIPGAPTLPVTTHLQNATSSLPLHSQPQQSDYSLHPNRQDHFVVPQAAASNSAAQPNPWPWAQQQAGMVQPAPSVPSEQQAPQTFQVPTAVGSSNGNPVPLPHLVAPTGGAATSVVNETLSSENKKEEPKDTDAEAHEDGEHKKSKDSKALKLFKLALADFVRDALKPTWKEGQLSRDIHKTIVKTVVDKVTSTVENVPQTKEKIDVYMSHYREKLNKLVQACASHACGRSTGKGKSIMPAPPPLLSAQRQPSLWEVGESSNVNGEAHQVCPICLTNDRDLAFIPCGHTCCRECGESLATCPICRQPIRSKLRLYSG